MHHFLFFETLVSSANFNCIRSDYDSSKYILFTITNSLYSSTNIRGPLCPYFWTWSYLAACIIILMQTVCVFISFKLCLLCYVNTALVCSVFCVVRSHLRSAILALEDALRLHKSCKQLRRIDTLQSMLKRSHDR